MAKLPAKSKTAIATATANQKVIEKVNKLEMPDFKVIKKGGTTTITGFSELHQQRVQLKEYVAPGIKQQAVTMIDDLATTQRIFESKRLTSEGYTQQQIADMLGVSQVTMSYCQMWCMRPSGNAPI